MKPADKFEDLIGRSHASLMADVLETLRDPQFWHITWDGKKCSVGLSPQGCFEIVKLSQDFCNEIYAALKPSEVVPFRRVQ